MNKTSNRGALSGHREKLQNHRERLTLSYLHKKDQMHQFLMHAWTNKPVAKKNKALNQILEKLDQIVEYSFLDELDDEFMGNFDEIDPDSECPEYEFGSFDSVQSAKEFILAELDVDWWTSYFSNILQLEVEWRHYRPIALKRYEALNTPDNRHLLEGLITEFRGRSDCPIGINSAPYHAYLEMWHRGVLLEEMPKGWWKPFSELLESASYPGLI